MAADFIVPDLPRDIEPSDGRISITPRLREREMREGSTLFTNAGGGFFMASEAARGRVSADELSPSDDRFLQTRGHRFDPGDAFAASARQFALAERTARPTQLDYLILVPTLRCNLSCTYCQVSRVGEERRGFDWTDATLDAVLTVIDALPKQRIKIEFQGGEPTLRPDLLRAVIDRCERFARREFVICTNLQHLNDETIALFDRADVFISTSLDGDVGTHERNRTKEGVATERFHQNLAWVAARYGPRKVSALPTIDSANPPEPDVLIDAYAAYGLDSIFLRPINYQGFARKRHKGSRELSDAWRAYYERFVRRLIERNWLDRDRVLEETYLSVALRRIFRPGSERHVDLRSPNPMGVDYIVVDHDGRVFPTDEARMLARSGVIDLSIGTIFDGWESDARAAMNEHATNEFDPTCRRCAYQPYCGRDLVDDIARYGRIDIPRQETAFCQRHLHLFDFAFELLYSDDPAVRYSLARWLRLPATPAHFGERLT